MTEQPADSTNPYASSEATGVATPARDVHFDSLGTKSARLSWQLPIVGVLVNLVLGAFMREQKAVLGGLLMIISAIGFLISIIALFSIFRFGWRKILLPASIGLLLNAALLYMFMSAILLAIQIKQSG